jgi:hypothetical protein
MKKILAILTISMFINSAYAGVCDYKPSRIISAGSGLIAGTGIIMKSTGMWAMAGSKAGATLLAIPSGGLITGSGTVGIGAIGAFLLSPVVMVATGVIAVGSGIMEGGCYLAGE